jgi:UDP:flavonoid glycosyltransferase YjiC (YdhE family)
MRITLVTIGSRGDVQPYIALGAGLAAAGHQVRLATNPEFAPAVSRYGLEFCPLHGDFRQVQASAAGQATLRSGDNPVAFMRRYRTATRSIMAQLLADAWQACQGSEAIVYGELATAFVPGQAELSAMLRRLRGQ